MRSVDELSELEECIDSELREAVAKGFRIRCGGAPDLDACVLAAIAWNRGLPSWEKSAEAMSLPIGPMIELARGFDGGSPLLDPDAESTAFLELGRRFRERVLAGEYNR